VQKVIASGGSISPAVDELLQPTVSFSWDTPGQGTSPQVVSSVLQALRKHLEVSFVPLARKEAEKNLSPTAPIAALLDAAEEMIERDFFSAEQLRPLNQVGACLGSWVEGVETLLGQKRTGATAGVNSVIGDILTEAKDALDMLQARVPPLSWTTSDVVPVIDKAIDAHWPGVARALLHEGLVGALKTTARVFRVRKQSLDAIAALAWQRKSSGEKSGSNGTEAEEVGGRGDRDFFTTPLCLSLESNGALDIVALRDFRQSLIKPMLFDAVLSIREPRTDLADVRAVEDRLADSLAALSDGMKRFLRDVDSHGWDVFRNGLAPQQSVNDHPYYRSICDIWRLAEPKIDLSKSRKYAVPLPVAITQQVPDSCVPHLLTHNLEVSLREAVVTEGCKRKTGEWLQILRLSYGFCLESISRYGKYVAATDEYVRRMGFEYSDLWLDKNWYIAYQSAAAEWRRQLGQKEQALEKRVYEASAARLGSFRKVAETVNERLRQQLHLLPDAAVSVRLAELHGGTNSRIDLILRDLPLADRDVVQEGVNRCVALIEHLVQSVEEGLVTLSGNEQKLAQDVLDKCRGELRQLREELTATDEVGG
jgi:hypothetical protein